MSSQPETTTNTHSDAHTHAHVHAHARANIFAERTANEELRRTDPAAFKAKMEAMLPESTCCFCRDTFRGYGNNPQPLLEGGTASDACNHSIVIAARFKAIGMQHMQSGEPFVRPRSED